MCACNRDGGERGCWPHTSGTVILAPGAGLFFFNIVLFKSHMCTHTHTHTLVRLDRVELGWVGVLWLNAFPVMLHRQASGLLFLLALSVFAPVSGCFLFFFLLSFFTVHRTAARDMSVNVVERDLNHILVMRYGPRLVLLSPDGKGMGTEERRTSRYNGGVGKRGEPASG